MARPMAVYLTIAIDIANKIINGDFNRGDKISGRSLLASRYNVSPETIRKAIAIFKEANVVNVSQGKEVTIVSLEQAKNLVEHNKNTVYAHSLKQEIEILLKQKEDNDKCFKNIMTEIMKYSDQLKNLKPFNPVEIMVKDESLVVDKPLEKIALWHNTGATIVAVRRNNEIIISPGPYFVLHKNDKIVVVGTKDVFHRVNKFIND